MKTEHTGGLITSATQRDEDSTMISVLGRNDMNCPMIPGHISRGAKATSVVRVEVATPLCGIGCPQTCWQ